MTPFPVALSARTPAPVTTPHTVGTLPDPGRTQKSRSG